MKYLFALLALIQAANAWVLNKENIQKAASIASISAAIAASPMVANAKPEFAGSYSDPKHENCLRVVEVKGNVAMISGTDGSPACPPDGAGKAWNLQGKINGDEIFIDFTPKGGPKDMTGLWEDDTPGIRFPDGNKWTKK
jgi:hypothetical protein